MPITLLQPHVINHIAAGEVIEKPSSVIKELIENAIDAQATRVEIEVEKAGLQSIKVSDNGHGISKDDFEFLFTRYATSKLKNLDDLLHLSTHGFRGEALFSMMSVADIEVLTKTVGEKNGTRISTHRGIVSEIEPIGHRIGTTIFVRNLFLHMPVRRKTLTTKTVNAEIRKAVESYAITYPGVAFTLAIDGKILFTSYEQQTDQERLLSCWKLSQDRLVFFEHVMIYGRIVGWMSKPEFLASHTRHQLITVNKRPVYSSQLRLAIDSGLKTFRHAGKHAQYAVHFELNPDLVDANIHPQKLQVKILHQKEIEKEISSAITHSFSQLHTSSLTYTGDQLFPLLHQTKVNDKGKNIEITGDILQIKNTYLLVQTNEGLLLVDQHAADEKLWYNRLVKEVKLLQKIESHVTEDCQKELDDDLYQHSFDELVNGKIATIACHSAIRAGQLLSQTEAKDLIQKVLNGGNETLTCPHGRPTYIHVLAQQLTQLFRRS